MTDGSHIHPDKYLSVAWADRPLTPSGPSASQVRAHLLVLVPYAYVQTC